MADERSDPSQKTEEPTQRKLDEARRKGQVASSREINTWFMLVAAAVMLTGFAPSMAAGLARAFRRFIETPHLMGADFAAASAAARGLVIDTALALAAPLAVLVVAAIGAGLVQNGLVIAAENLQPKLERISLFGGVKRLASLRSLTEFVKGLVKIAIVGTVAVWLVWPELARIDTLVQMAPADVLGALYRLALRLVVGVAAVMALIAALDFLYQRFEFRKQMRMSRQELKDEFKQTEGDPAVRGRIRQIRQERARRRMMAAVPEASVVVTNPTHFAVALKYEQATMAAPRVVAKGADTLARRIREIAAEHAVPIVENRPLAQALYAGVELDQEIPPEHYKAVAEIIGYVMRLKRGDRRPYRPGR